MVEWDFIAPDSNPGLPWMFVSDFLLFRSIGLSLVQCKCGHNETKAPPQIKHRENERKLACVDALYSRNDQTGTYLCSLSLTLRKQCRSAVPMYLVVIRSESARDSSGVVFGTNAYQRVGRIQQKVTAREYPVENRHTKLTRLNAAEKSNLTTNQAPRATYPSNFPSWPSTDQPDINRSEEFEDLSGVRQRCILSPILFLFGMSPWCPLCRFGRGAWKASIDHFNLSHQL